MKMSLVFLLLAMAAAGCSGGGDGGETVTPPPTATTEVTVLAFNDLGMHCMGREFSVFSILPPFNVVHAQIIERSESETRLLDAGTVGVAYQATADADGSINSTSANGKTDFWEYVEALFGTPLAEGEGLTGLYLPADHPTDPGPQAMAHEATLAWFSADGIPITPTDDAMRTNSYPLMRISALEITSGDSLASLDIVAGGHGNGLPGLP